MARARAISDWNHTAAIAAQLHNLQELLIVQLNPEHELDWQTAADCHPFIPTPPEPDQDAEIDPIAVLESSGF